MLQVSKAANGPILTELRRALPLLNDTQLLDIISSGRGRAALNTSVEQVNLTFPRTFDVEDPACICGCLEFRKEVICAHLYAAIKHQPQVRSEGFPDMRSLVARRPRGRTPRDGPARSLN